MRRVVKATINTNAAAGAAWYCDAHGAARALVMSQRDDVATLIDEARAGDAVVVMVKDGTAVDRVVAASDVPRFHKIALHELPSGSEVRKYGEVIGIAIAAVRRGEYVHTHNLESARVGVAR